MSSASTHKTAKLTYWLASRAKSQTLTVLDSYGDEHGMLTETWSLEGER